MLRFLLIGVGASALIIQCGCVSRSAINDVMLPLAVVRKIVMENIPAGLRKESMNGREITGEYFEPKNLDSPSDSQRERAFAIITILGSRRPYQLAIRVELEERDKGSKRYYRQGQDQRLAEQVRKRIQEALANRPADLNVIDDFRAF